MTAGTEQGQNGHEARKGTTDQYAEIRAEREAREAEREAEREARMAFEAEREAEREARMAFEAKREEEANQRTLNREARDVQEHESRMMSRALDRDAEQRFTALLDVAVKVGTAYAPVADAHAGAAVAKFKTATLYEEAKQELLTQILKAQTPEELKSLQQKLEAIHKVATI